VAPCTTRPTHGGGNRGPLREELRLLPPLPLQQPSHERPPNGRRHNGSKRGPLSVLRPGSSLCPEDVRPSTAVSPFPPPTILTQRVRSRSKTRCGRATSITAMSVIIGRAIPDVRDGLKPVHRRILYSMYEQGLGPNQGLTERAPKRSATCSPSTIRTATRASTTPMVRLAQDFRCAIRSSDGQGNFARSTATLPAAYRLHRSAASPASRRDLPRRHRERRGRRRRRTSTTPRRSRPSFPLDPEPSHHGSGGIAVGMATNIPPHNLGILDATNPPHPNPDATIDDMMRFVPGSRLSHGGPHLRAAPGSSSRSARVAAPS